MNKKLYTILIVIMLSAFSLNIVSGGSSLTVDIDDDEVETGETVEIIVSGGTDREPVLITVEFEEDVVVYEQGFFDTNGDYTFIYRIDPDLPNSEYGTYIVKVKDVASSNTATTNFEVNSGFTNPSQYVPPPSGGGSGIETGNETDAVTPKDIEELNNTDAAKKLEGTKSSDAAKIIEQVNSTKAGEIVGKMNSTKAAQILSKTNSTKAAEILLKTDGKNASKIILELNATEGAAIVEKMSKSNLNETAVIVEDAVKEKIAGITDEETRKQVLKKLADTMASLSPESLVDLFTTIANLPNTPSTVALMMEAMTLQQVIPVVNQWASTGAFTEMSKVYAFLSPATFEAVFAGMLPEYQSALYPYFTEQTATMVPALITYQYTSLTVAPSSIAPGEPVTVSVTLSNPSTPGTYTSSFLLDGNVDETFTGTLGTDESIELSYTTTANAAGSYTVQVGDLSDTFTVLSPATFDLSALRLSATEAEIGDQITVSATIQNSGDLDGEYEYIIDVDGVVIDTEMITIEGGESSTKEYTITAETPGTHTVTISDESVTFTVAEEPSSSPVLVYGVVAVLILAAAGYYFYSRQQA